MDQNDKQSTKYRVPGRINLDELHREELELKDAQEVTHPKKSPKLLNAMSMVSVGLDFAVILAAPLIIGIYVGKYIDTRMGTKYWVIVCLLVAMATSAVGIYRQTKRLAKLMKK